MTRNDMKNSERSNASEQITFVSSSLESFLGHYHRSVQRWMGFHNAFSNVTDLRREFSNKGEQTIIPHNPKTQLFSTTMKLELIFLL